MRLLFLFVASLSSLLAVEPPSAEALQAAAANYLAKRPVALIEKGFALEDGYKAQTIFVKELVGKLGKPAGYKIGLITKPNQERMGANSPVRGVLLEKM